MNFKNVLRVSMYEPCARCGPVPCPQLFASFN